MFWKTANLIRRPFLRSHIIAHRTSIIESVIMFMLACYYYVILCLGQNACCDWLILRVVFFQVLSVCHSLELKYFPSSRVRNVTKKQLFTFFVGLHVRYIVFRYLFLFCFIFFPSVYDRLRPMRSIQVRAKALGTARVKNAVRMRVFPASGAYLPLKLYAITKQTRFRPRNLKK